MKPKLSIMVPTYRRKEKFQKLFLYLLDINAQMNDIQIVVACQDDEYLPKDEYPKSVKILNNSRFNKLENPRIRNYLSGFKHCKGKYTLILEDDDIIPWWFIEYFVTCDYDMKLPLYVYDFINQDTIFKNRSYLMKGENFIHDFPDMTQGKFQWGLCITNTSALKYYSEVFWDDPNCNIVQSDEVITLMIAKDAKEIKLSSLPVLNVGISNDNYSWNKDQEKADIKFYEYALRKFILDDDKWIKKMKGMYE